MRGGATLCTELWAGQWQTPGIPALFVNPQNSGILNAVTQARNKLTCRRHSG